MYIYIYFIYIYICVYIYTHSWLLQKRVLHFYFNIYIYTHSMYYKIVEFTLELSFKLISAQHVKIKMSDSFSQEPRV